ncbi:unnamed protein product, partial [Laminaria digitata]
MKASYTGDQYRVQLGWGTDTTPLSQRPQADQDAHQYCTQKRNEAIATLAAGDIQRYAIIALQEREEYYRAVEKRTKAQGSCPIPTPKDQPAGVIEEIIDQLIQQKRYGVAIRQEELVRVLIAIRDHQEQHNQPQQQPEPEQEHDGDMETQKVVEEEQVVDIELGQQQTPLSQAMPADDDGIGIEEIRVGEQGAREEQAEEERQDGMVVDRQQQQQQQQQQQKQSELPVQPPPQQ